MASTQQTRFQKDLETKIRNKRSDIEKMRQRLTQLEHETAAAEEKARAAGAGSDASWAASGKRHELVSWKDSLTRAEEELQRLEEVARLDWQGLSSLDKVMAKKAAIQAAQDALEEQIAEAEAELQHLTQEIEQRQVELALRNEFTGEVHSDEQLSELQAKRDELQKHIRTLQQRLMAHRSDSVAVARRLGITTPAAELAALTEAMWRQVEEMKAAAEARRQDLQTRFNQLISELADVARELGRVKAQLMLMDDELTAAGFERTGAHEAVNLSLPYMQELEIKLKTAFLEGPLAVHPTYQHRW